MSNIAITWLKFLPSFIWLIATFTAEEPVWSKFGNAHIFNIKSGCGWTFPEYSYFTVKFFYFSISWRTGTFPCKLTGTQRPYLCSLVMLWHTFPKRLVNISIHLHLERLQQLPHQKVCWQCLCVTETLHFSHCIALWMITESQSITHQLY